jgi:hypothetical protein
MTGRVAAVLTTIAVACTAGAADAQCLTSRGSFVDGDTHEIVLTPLGQRAEATERSGSPGLAAGDARGVPAVRIVEQSTKRVFHARFSSDNGTVLKSNLGPGTYTATLVVARFRWPADDTAFEPVANCDPITLEVRDASAGRWLPNPQVFVEAHSHIGAGAEAFAGRWGLAVVANQPWTDWNRRPDARLELRVAGTRGVFGTGWRLDGDADGYRSSLSVSGALELPPFVRHPMWLVLETHVAGRDGVGNTTTDLLRALSVRLRLDLRRVWR